jgi:hypothetical protein
MLSKIRRMTSTLAGGTTTVETLSLSLTLLDHDVSRLTITAMRRHLNLLGELVVVADYVARPGSADPVALVRAGFAGNPLQMQISQAIGRTEILRLSYESPLEIALIVAPTIAASVSALATLIYGLKRLYGVDLEFRTYREERRAEYLAAKDLATRLADTSESSTPTDLPDVLPEAVGAIDSRVADGHQQRAQRATLSDDDGLPV